MKVSVKYNVKYRARFKNETKIEPSKVSSPSPESSQILNFFRFNNQIFKEYIVYIYKMLRLFTEGNF